MEIKTQTWLIRSSVPGMGKRCLTKAGVGIINRLFELFHSLVEIRKRLAAANNDDGLALN